MFTVSIWESEDDLNAYRNSELFENTWAKTKVLFNDKPEAWSLEFLK
jgi:heme-degrading monooxygenase HmoA